MGSWYLDPGGTLNHLALEIRGAGNGRDSPWRLGHSGNLKTKSKAPLALGSKQTRHRHEASAGPGCGRCRRSCVLGTFSDTAKATHEDRVTFLHRITFSPDRVLSCSADRGLGAKRRGVMNSQDVDWVRWRERERWLEANGQAGGRKEGRKEYRTEGGKGKGKDKKGKTEGWINQWGDIISVHTDPASRTRDRKMGGPCPPRTPLASGETTGPLL